MTADLHEYITLGRIALRLRKPGGPGHTTCFHYFVTDLQSMLCKLESASDIHDPSDHTTSFHNLFTCVRDVVSEEHFSSRVRHPGESLCTETMEQVSWAGYVLSVALPCQPHPRLVSNQT